MLEKLNRLIDGRARAARRQDLKALEPVITYIAEQYAASGGVIPFEVSPE